MISRSELQEKLNSLMESLRNQEAFQQLKAKWEEVDPQSRTYLKFAAAAGSLLIAFLFVLSAVWSVHSLKSEYQSKQELLHEIQTANDEIRRLKDSMPNSALNNPGGDQQSTPWSAYFENTASTSGIDKSNLIISSEKTGTSSEQSKELLFDLSLKNVNIKQVVKYAFNLENGSRPVKLRNLQIDTKPDASGYLDASLSISAFTLVVPK